MNTLITADEFARDIHEGFKRVTEPIFQEMRAAGKSEDEINMTRARLLFDLFQGLHRFPPEFRP